MGERNLQQVKDAEVKRLLGHKDSPVRVGKWVFNLPSLQGVFDVSVRQVDPYWHSPLRVSLELDDGTERFDRVLTVEEIAGAGVRTHHGRLSLNGLINWARQIKDRLSYQYYQT